MITVRDFMELVGYRITEGDKYGWRCYGSNAYCLSSWNGVHGTGGWSTSIVFDTETQVVYEMDVCDYTNDRAYRIINTLYRGEYTREAAERQSCANVAWDGVNYTDLEVAGDMIEKARAIVAGVDYDTRISVPLDLEDGELLHLCLEAHRRDITLNELVVEALEKVIKESSHA